MDILKKIKKVKKSIDKSSINCYDIKVSCVTTTCYAGVVQW